MRKSKLVWLLAAVAWAASTYAAEPLLSWNDGAAKESILRFVSAGNAGGLSWFCASG